MRRAVSTLGCLALALAVSGCWKKDELPRVVDQMAFQHAGGTLFTNPDTLTLKEIHLDNGKLTGREVIVEGRLAEVGNHRTYLVLTDDAARMLVVLTGLDADVEPLLKGKDDHWRVLGTVESGKKGLPYIMARAVSLAPADAAVPKA
jgi:hypothetical protein